MQSAAQRADEKIRGAFETCGRGALFAGRAELIQALRLIAQNADALQGGSVHSDALAAGMRAMAEAEAFVPRGSRLESELDMVRLVASHRTPVVRVALAGPERGRKITPLEAQNRYYTYAQQQFAVSTAGLPVGAVALYGLGKVHSAQASADSESRSIEEPRAMTMYQAALIADPGNPLAAHELGVLLARYQRYDEALAMLQQSARIASLPETWHNLALVHERRGEADLARRARQEADNARARLGAAKPASHPALARGSVRWLSAAQFAQTRPADTNLRPAAEAKTPAATSPAPPSTPPKETAKPSGILSWLPWTKKG
jgi:tetratricopeptide (TPR) repeat protein